MSQLNFNINSSGDCSRIRVQDCSEFCSSNTYSNLYHRAVLLPGSDFHTASFTKSFLNATASSGTLTGLSYTVNGGSANVIGNPYLTFTETDELVAGLNTIVVTSTDDQSIGNSTSTIYIFLDSAGTPTWWFFPGMDEDTSAFPADTDVVFTPNNTIDTVTTVTSQTLNTGDTTVISSFPDTHDYPSTTTTYTQTHTVVILGTDGAHSSANTYRFKVTVLSNACDDQMTTGDIDTVTLHATTPDGILYTSNITTAYLTFQPFYLDAEELLDSSDGELADFSDAGKWTFKIIITKSPGATTYVLEKCINVYLICSILCSWGKMLHSMTQKDDCDCSHVDTAEFCKMSMYMNGLLDSIACDRAADADRAIEMMELLLANSGCGC